MPLAIALLLFGHHGLMAGFPQAELATPRHHRTEAASAAGAGDCAVAPDRMPDRPPAPLPEGCKIGWLAASRLALSGCADCALVAAPDRPLTSGGMQTLAVDQPFVLDPSTRRALLQVYRI